MSGPGNLAPETDAALARPPARRPRLGITPERRALLADRRQRTKRHLALAPRVRARILMAAVRELASARLGLTARELADRLEMSHRSGFRLMSALLDAGFVERSGQSGRYRSLVSFRDALTEGS